MLPNQPPGIYSISPSLCRETRGIGGIVNRKQLLFKNVVLMDIRHRHFCRRNQKVIGPLHFKKLFFKFWKLTRTRHRCSVHNKGRKYLTIPMFPGMEIQHEIDQCSFQLCPKVEIECESGSCDLCP